MQKSRTEICRVRLARLASTVQRTTTTGTIRASHARLAVSVVLSPANALIVRLAHLHRRHHKDRARAPCACAAHTVALVRPCALRVWQANTARRTARLRLLAPLARSRLVAAASVPHVLLANSAQPRRHHAQRHRAVSTPSRMPRVASLQPCRVLLASIRTPDLIRVPHAPRANTVPKNRARVLPAHLASTTPRPVLIRASYVATANMLAQQGTPIVPTALWENTSTKTATQRATIARPANGPAPNIPKLSASLSRRLHQLRSAPRFCT